MVCGCKCVRLRQTARVGDPSTPLSVADVRWQSGGWRLAGHSDSNSQGRGPKYPKRPLRPLPIRGLGSARCPSGYCCPVFRCGRLCHAMSVCCCYPLPVSAGACYRRLLPAQSSWCSALAGHGHTTAPGPSGQSGRAPLCRAAWHCLPALSMAPHPSAAAYERQRHFSGPLAADHNPHDMPPALPWCRWLLLWCYPLCSPRPTVCLVPHRDWSRLSS